MSPQRTIDLPNAGGEEVHETVHGLLAGHHAVDVVPVQHAQLTGQPGWMEIIFRDNIENYKEIIMIIIRIEIIIIRII